MNKWEQKFKIAELIAESEEQRRFDEFYEKIPNVIIRHKTQESHLPLKFVINEQRKVGEVGMILMLTAEEWSILLGLLEDAAQSDDANEAYPIQTRIAIKSIIQKLGGTFFGIMECP